MKSIWMLAAVASLAACAGRGEDDMGAAPDRGDTTAVTTGADTTQIDTLNTGGMVTDTSTSNVEPTTPAAEPTTPAPTTPTDTAGQSGTYPSDTTSVTNPSGGYETPAPSADTTTVPSADPGMSPETVPSDSATIDQTVPSADSAATPQ